VRIEWSLGVEELGRVPDIGVVVEAVSEACEGSEFVGSLVVKAVGQGGAKLGELRGSDGDGSVMWKRVRGGQALREGRIWLHADPPT
jgi:hypothetical protein